MGCRRCSRCEVYFSGLEPGVTQCPCCGNRLRFKPANRRASTHHRKYLDNQTKEFERLGWITGTRIRSPSEPRKAPRILTIQKNL